MSKTPEIRIVRKYRKAGTPKKPQLEPIGWCWVLVSSRGDTVAESAEFWTHANARKAAKRHQEMMARAVLADA